jgi:hypothetical protein
MSLLAPLLLFGQVFEAASEVQQLQLADLATQDS